MVKCHRLTLFILVSKGKPKTLCLHNEAHTGKTIGAKSRAPQEVYVGGMNGVTGRGVYYGTHRRSAKESIVNADLPFFCLSCPGSL